MFESYKIDLDKPVVMTCGGAVVAPLVCVAGFLATEKIWPVYDVSHFVVMLGWFKIEYEHLLSVFCLQYACIVSCLYMYTYCQLSTSSGLVLVCFCVNIESYIVLSTF